MPEQDRIVEALDWSSAPEVGSADWQSKFGGQEWRYDSKGVYLRSGPDTPLRSRGEPTTCTAILAAYGAEILEASKMHQVPPEIIVMTIATETAMFRKSNFTGPPTFRWERKVKVRDVRPPTTGDYSAGPMQVLATTARSLIKDLKLPYPDRFRAAPYYKTKPIARPDENPLYEGEVCIDIGTAYIRNQAKKTKLNPILVSAGYNAGSVRRSDARHQNLWNIFTHGDHLDRASKWFGDACFVLSPLRQGRQLDTGGVDADPPVRTPEDEVKDIELSGLTKEQADEQAKFYRDSGADVEVIPEVGGRFTLLVFYDEVAPPGQAPDVGELGVAPPDRDGFVICIDRIRSEKRKGKPFARTVGHYCAFFNKQPIDGVFGVAVERQGPGDNTSTGVSRHRRIAEGAYPLLTHAGSGNNKYRTYGYADPGGFKIRPWPAIRVGDTRRRTGILFHCARGYLMSIGCINLTGKLANVSSDMEFGDSRVRVISLIQSMKRALGNKFPSGNNMRIKDGWVIIRGEP